MNQSEQNENRNDNNLQMRSFPIGSSFFSIGIRRDLKKGYKKSSPDKSDELLNMLEDIFEAFNLTYLSAAADGIGTFSFATGEK